MAANTVSDHLSQPQHLVVGQETSTEEKPKDRALETAFNKTGGTKVLLNYMSKFNTYHT
jgi:hypothetical protein